MTLHEFTTWLSDNRMTVYMVFMAIVQALPEPEPENHRVYRWIYAFAHGLSMNINPARRTFEKRTAVLRARKLHKSGIEVQTRTDLGSGETVIVPTSANSNPILPEPNGGKK